MKLFIVAALVSVAAAARLEHLERAYLPPYHGQAGLGSQGQGFGSQGSFGSGSGSFGSGSGSGSFRSGSGSFRSGSFDSNVVDSADTGRSQAFLGATSNQYLPPDHGPSGSGSNGQFSGSLSGFRSQGFGGSNQNQYGSGSNFGRPQSNQFQASRQYLAPERSYQEVPQQAFDEQTGYHY